MSTKIIIAERKPALRSTIRFIVESLTDMEVVSETGDNRVSVDTVRRVNPDIIIMEIIMPDLEGIAEMRSITSSMPNVKIIALGIYPDEKLVLEIFRAGASGFLLKSCLFDDLENTIRSAIDNKYYLSNKSAGSVIDKIINKYPPSNIPEFLSLLTERELSVFFSISAGRSVYQITKEMNIDTKSVALLERQIMALMVNLYSMKETTS